MASMNTKKSNYLIFVDGIFQCEMPTQNSEKHDKFDIKDTSPVKDTLNMTPTSSKKIKNNQGQDSFTNSILSIIIRASDPRPGL